MHRRMVGREPDRARVLAEVVEPSGVASRIRTPRMPRPRGSSPIAAWVSASMPVVRKRSSSGAARGRSRRARRSARPSARRPPRPAAAGARRARAPSVIATPASTSARRRFSFGLTASTCSAYSAGRDNRLPDAVHAAGSNLRSRPTRARAGRRGARLQRRRFRAARRRWHHGHESRRRSGRPRARDRARRSRSAGSPSRISVPTSAPARLRESAASSMTTRARASSSLRARW